MTDLHTEPANSLKTMGTGVAPDDVRHNWSRAEVEALFDLPFNDLLFQAQTAHRKYFDPNQVQMSTLLSIKTGGCPEDCKYCSQSASWDTPVKATKLMEPQEVIEEAKAAKAAGASRYCMGAAWREPKDRDMDDIVEMIEGVRGLGLETCMTLGMLSEDQAKRLGEAGLDYYNHNIDTSPEFYGDIITTRTIDDRFETLERVRDAGINVCCGGIVGMGEERSDRAGMILALANLPVHPESVPINMLIQTEGTPVFGIHDIDPLEFVRTIAVSKITMPASIIRLSAGREWMSDEMQALCFMAGAGSIFIGPKLLTTKNPAQEKDESLFRRLGIEAMPVEVKAEAPAEQTVEMQTVADPFAVSSTDGVRLTMADGRELIDGTSSWWTSCHGYNHPHIRKAVADQMEKMPHVMMGGIIHEPAARLADRLAALAPGDLNHVFFSDSGSVSVEASMKMAVQHWRNKGLGGRHKFISFMGGYHGDTIAAMSVCDPEDGMHALFGDFLQDQYVVPLPETAETYNQFEQVLIDHGSECAAIMLEPLVQGAGGMKMHDAEVLRNIRDLADRYDLLIIADEIMTGFGRTGSMFACEEAGIVPDIMTLSKALTGGTMPMAATIARSHVFDAFLDDDAGKAFMHGPTFMGNALGCAAAHASLDLFEQEPRLEQVAHIERRLTQSFAQAEAIPGVKDVRVKGAIAALQMEALPDLDGLKKGFVDAGVWVRPFADVIYLMPSFTIDDKDLSALMDRTLEVTGNWAQKHFKAD
ncbi:bioB [Symbiodinium microadriaticum]|nr:bioB [Symbiodinium microadriaticum]